MKNVVWIVAAACVLSWLSGPARADDKHPEITLWPDGLPEGATPLDPKKIEQLRTWPAYRGCADIVSHLAFCNYLREFYGPDYTERTIPLKK